MSDDMREVPGLRATCPSCLGNPVKVNMENERFVCGVCNGEGSIPIRSNIPALFLATLPEPTKTGTLADLLGKTVRGIAYEPDTGLVMIFTDGSELRVPGYPLQYQIEIP